jgi:hypothetical protein
MILSETSQPWHALTAEAVAEKLDTDLNRGLSPSEAQQRQEKYGRNKLRAKPSKSSLGSFLGEFRYLPELRLSSSSILLKPYKVKSPLWLYNLAAVFTIFELVSQSINNLPLARTMAVQTLVAAETFYLLSMSHCLPSLGAYVKNKICRVAYIPLIGVACVALLQILFSQLPLINYLLSLFCLQCQKSDYIPIPSVSNYYTFLVFK